jgi:hypothetical protein
VETDCSDPAVAAAVTELSTAGGACLVLCIQTGSNKRDVRSRNTLESESGVYLERFTLSCLAVVNELMTAVVLGKPAT